MKVAIEVKDRNEASQLKTAMSDPTVRAFTLIMGVLLGLPTNRSRRRVMTYVEDWAAEQAELSEEKA